MASDKIRAKEAGGDKAATSAAAASVVQCKLAIGAANDPLEAEADTMADTVMRMPETLGSPGLAGGKGNSLQRKCAGCEEEEQVQRKPLASFIQKKGSEAGAVASDAVSSKINSTKGSGSGMDRPTQSFMESRFGADFSAVKIHTGNDAVQMSSELNAQAFTVGNDIYFNSGKYNPSSDSGKHLLAHELTHTVQQGVDTNTGVQRKIQVNPGLKLDTQGFSVTKTGDVYSCPAVVKGSVWNEIFTALLNSPRVFKIAGSTDAEVKTNFLKHMTARYDTVGFAALKKYSFKAGSGMTMNPAYWVNDATGWHVKPGVDRSKAIGDLNINPKEYKIACEMATRVTMEAGGKSTVLLQENGAAAADWIPGDAGYIENTSFSGTPGLEGENLIYTGKDLFWGHFGPGNTYKSLADWFADVKSWDGAAVIKTHRLHTDAGLE